MTQPVNVRFRVEYRSGRGEGTFTMKPGMYEGAPALPPGRYSPTPQVELEAAEQEIEELRAKLTKAEEEIEELRRLLWGDRV